MIAIVDYRAGNLTSVRLAFEALDAPAVVTQDPAQVLAAERVVFPGVGAAASAMDNLQELNLRDAIVQVINEGRPFLGICIGMQLLLATSEEDGGTDCLGVIPGAVRKFPVDVPGCKIPQMGWNSVDYARQHPLFAGIDEGSEFYFVHSFYPDPADDAYRVGRTDYAGVAFTSAAGRDNLFATQFHPERSGRIGLRLLENFCKWDGRC